MGLCAKNNHAPYMYMYIILLQQRLYKVRTYNMLKVETRETSSTESLNSGPNWGSTQDFPIWVSGGRGV